ncbi:MAG: histidine phosphatase family protein [Winogradskyella sp.]|uniref:SixA phosphatase family protein n=1 Tax=Winogradskyella sp. TaxID=1883156 RepID=UPI000F407039|nr:phosphoglycerate mutase family protein [Winogradskyella sp.]RNC87164.1 MAG: histidine phosphatase family protein [Winogradskyella sp.]
MKTIIFVRHAKSSWKHDVSDIDRPLKSRGINDALLISKELKLKNIEIDFVYTSPANRAASTCKIFMNSLNINDDKLLIVKDLYDFGGESVLKFITSLDNDYKTIMIFGHNFAFTSLINTLGDMYIDNLPTAGIAIIEFNIDSWQYVKYGHTRAIMFPKDYRSVNN